ncbi:uncharacterized protein [Emydura macquarii macquarii]|uniref:uncharacterized protein isoform X2 n=1 Tax=Emydura macquarii macquarii TaxID=1129001 RepID=UPI00352AF9A6
MRLWLLGGLAAALAVVAVAGADQGGSTVKDEARVRTRGKDKKPPAASNPCPGCYSILSQLQDTPVRARTQVERSSPRPTWRPGVVTPLSEAEARVPTRGKDKKPPASSNPCPGCYSVLSKPVRGRRQVEQPRQRPRPKPDWRPGSMSFLRPGKEEKLDLVSTKVPDSEVRNRRDIERLPPRRRPRPRPKPTEHPPYNNGFMIILGSSTILRPQGPDPPGRVRRAVEGAQPRTLKPKRPRLPCSGCYGPLVSSKDDYQQVRVKRDGQKPQRPVKKLTWRPGSGSIIGLRPQQQSSEIPRDGKAKLPCPGCHGSVTPGQEERAAERIPSTRSKREGQGPPSQAKRQAKQRARAGLYCAGCYSGLTLSSQPAPPREEGGRSEADGGSSGD